MKLNLTDEQRTPEWATVFTIDAGYFWQMKPIIEHDNWICSYDDCENAFESVKFDNWRELCFERPKDKCCENGNFGDGHDCMKGLDRVIKPTIDKSASILKCRDCARILHVFSYWPKEGGVTLDFRHHECKQENKPVNEACLFKSVLVFNSATNEYDMEKLYLGIDSASPRIVALLVKDGLANITWHLNAKRIPGYDYGD